jgi:hypothetical protein
LLSVVTSNNGNQSFTVVPPDSVIDAIPVPAPPGQSIAGADLGEQLGAIGFTRFQQTSRVTTTRL